LNNKELNFEEELYNCELQEFRIHCDSLLDGNGDGYCGSGESCFIYDVKNGKFKLEKEKRDSPKLKKLKIK